MRNLNSVVGHSTPCQGTISGQSKKESNLIRMQKNGKINVSIKKYIKHTSATDVL